MRKILVSLVGLLLLVGASVADAAVFNFQVRDEQGKNLATGYTVQVYTLATQAHDTIFSDTGYGTQITNPMNPDSRGSFKFATSQDTVDLVVWGVGGRAKGAVSRIKDLTDHDHIVTVQTQNDIKHLRIFYDSKISKGAEVNTKIDIPVGAVVLDAWIQTATGYPMASVSVGLLSTEASGFAQGFCMSQSAADAATPGQYFRCEASRRNIIGDDQVAEKWFERPWFWSSNARGKFLASFSLGFNKGLDNLAPWVASQGQYYEYQHAVQQGAAHTISYTTSDVGHTAETGVGIGYAGYIHIFYRELNRR